MWPSSARSAPSGTPSGRATRCLRRGCSSAGSRVAGSSRPRWSPGLLALHPDAHMVAGEDRAAREVATLGAMRAGAPVIVGGRLPADLAGRRVGEPDLLVAASGRSGYRPVDIKHHRCLDAGPGGLPARCSPLDRLVWEAAEVDPGSSARKRKDDLLQLAHYQRMLEAAGMAASGGPPGRHHRRRRRRHLVRPGRPDLADPVGGWPAEAALDHGGVRLRVRLPPGHPRRRRRAPSRSRGRAAGGSGPDRRVRGVPLVVVVRPAAGGWLR